MIISALSTKTGGRKCSSAISTSSEVGSNQKTDCPNPMSNPKALDKSSQTPEKDQVKCLCQKLYKKVVTQEQVASSRLKKPIVVPVLQLLRK